MHCLRQVSQIIIEVLYWPQAFGSYSVDIEHHCREQERAVKSFSILKIILEMAGTSTRMRSGVRPEMDGRNICTVYKYHGVPILKVDFSQPLMFFVYLQSSEYCCLPAWNIILIILHAWNRWSCLYRHSIHCVWYFGFVPNTGARQTETFYGSCCRNLSNTTYRILWL